MGNTEEAKELSLLTCTEELQGLKEARGKKIDELAPQVQNNANTAMEEFVAKEQKLLEELNVVSLQLKVLYSPVVTFGGSEPEVAPEVL